MTHYFTYYWKNETMRKYSDREGGYSPWVASNGFDRKKITAGDYIYAVSVKHGELILLKGIQVGKIYPRLEWSRKVGLDPDQLWQSNEFFIAQKSSRISFNRSIPADVTRSLLFYQEGIESPLKFIDPEHRYLDPQTLRGNREMPPGTADILNSFLDEFAPVNEAEAIQLYKKS